MDIGLIIRGRNACSLRTSLGRLHCFIRPGALRFSAAGNHGHYDGAREEEHAVSDFSINHKVSHLSFISLFASIVREGFNKQINNFGEIFHRSWTPTLSLPWTSQDAWNFDAGVMANFDAFEL